MFLVNNKKVIDQSIKILIVYSLQVTSARVNWKVDISNLN